MRNPIRSVAVIAALIPLLVLTGCGEDEAEEAASAASSDCPAELTAEPASAPPADLPITEGLTVYRSDAQGSTTVFFAVADGASTELVDVRDRVTDSLEGAGYEIEGRDQEEGAEAEAEFAGPHSGTVQVRPICTGRLVIRYKLTS